MFEIRPMIGDFHQLEKDKTPYCSNCLGRIDGPRNAEASLDYNNAADWAACAACSTRVHMGRKHGCWVELARGPKGVICKQCADAWR